MFLRLLFFLALALQVSAQETMIRHVYDPATDTHVEVIALFTEPSAGGFFPVRVKIANNLKTDRSARLSFEINNSGGPRSSSSFDFSAGAGKTVTRDVLVPLPPPGGYGSSTLVVHMTGSLGITQNSIYSNNSNTDPQSLLSESLFTPNASTLDSEFSKKGGSKFASKFDPKQLPDNWLAFSGYDNVIMTDSDWSAVPAGARTSILSWVRLGGRLVIYSVSNSSAAELGLPEEAGYGLIEVHPILPTLLLDAVDTVDDVLGNPIMTRQMESRDNFSAGWPLQKLFGSQTFRYGMFVIVLIIFGILVGPVNLFVFAKAGQRHRLFITTPLISLGASLILILLIIVQDGFGGSGMRRVLMEVRPDDGLNAAYIQQEQFCRTGVLTGTGFTISTPSFFNPVVIANSRWSRFTSSNPEGSFNLQPADGKLAASGDWFQSRSEHGHVLSAVVSTRGRIESTATPGVFLSTFDFPVKTIFFLSEDGQWQRADGIVAGKPFTPIEADPSMVLPELNQQAAEFGTRNKQFMKTAMTRSGHFIAITENAPGIETNPGIRWKETRTVITGPVVAP